MGQGYAVIVGEAKQSRSGNALGRDCRVAPLPAMTTNPNAEPGLCRAEGSPKVAPGPGQAGHQQWRWRGAPMSDPIPAQKAPYQTTVEAGKRYFWCACGRSANQPF